MKLADLNPRMETQNILICDCPCGGKHKLRIPFSDQQHEWKCTGQLRDLSVKPSIQTECWTGFIRDGEIVTV